MKPTGIVLTASLVVAACSSLDGDYAPDCLAFEGDRITLDNGRFVWTRFTDQVRIGADGNPVDPYPGFPRSGTFRLDGDRLVLAGDDGRRFDDWFVVRLDGRPALLTAAERAAVRAGSAPPECALVPTSFQN